MKCCQAVSVPTERDPQPFIIRQLNKGQEGHRDVNHSKKRMCKALGGTGRRLEESTGTVLETEGSTARGIPHGRGLVI
jgi:hypothetical protein